MAFSLIFIKFYKRFINALNSNVSLLPEFSSDHETSLRLIFTRMHISLCYGPVHQMGLQVGVRHSMLRFVDDASTINFMGIFTLHVKGSAKLSVTFKTSRTVKYTLARWKAARISPFRLGKWNDTTWSQWVAARWTHWRFYKTDIGFTS